LIFEIAWAAFTTLVKVAGFLRGLVTGLLTVKTGANCFYAGISLVGCPGTEVIVPLGESTFKVGFLATLIC
jgi:hypothetical protein